MEKYVRDKNNGEFLMTVSDFSKIYSNLFTGFELSKQYSCSIIREQWNAKTPSGICKAKGATEKEAIEFCRNNHQYLLEISKPTDVLMMLIQLDGRLYRGQKYPYKTVCNGINILVFTLDGEKTLEKFDIDKLTLRKLKFELRREVSFWHKFEPGRYAVIPCKIKNDILDSDIELRVYSDAQVGLRKVRGPNNSFVPLKEETFKNINQGGITSMLEVIRK